MQILGEFQTSVRRALEEIDPNYEKYPGLVICGTHAPKEIVDQLIEIREARERGTPFLGICHGHQLAAVEYARNVLGNKNADSEEWGRGEHIVKKLPSLKVGLYRTDPTRLDSPMESYWNNYEIIPGFEELWNKGKPKTQLTMQYHPEYNSSIDRPHPDLIKFVNMCKNYGKKG